MLENLRFPKKPNKEEYHTRREELSQKLMMLQQECKRVGLPVVIAVEGWGSSGKGSRISDLVVDLDPRLFSVYTTEDPIGYENRLPFLARFWSRIGEHGTFTIFDRAWYDAAARVLIDTADKDAQSILSLKDFGGLQAYGLTPRLSRALHANKPEDALESFVDSIASIEQQLHNDGYLIVKLFLHITQEEQRKRFVKLMLNKETSWRIDQDDIRQAQRYEDYYKVFESLLEHTNYDFAPWHLIAAHERRSANLMILETLVGAIEEVLAKRHKQEELRAQEAANKKERISRSLEELNSALSAMSAAQQGQEGDRAAKGKAADKTAVPSTEELTQFQLAYTQARIGSAEGLKSRFKLKKVQDLQDVSYDHKISRHKDYKTQLKEEQKRLKSLQSQLYRLRVPVIIAYEGWDAAGKGGNIKRVARALDARSYMVHPISAPSSLELAHPFLWRFWTKLPRTGHMAIFDRTWYGRVMVERVEGFAREDEWKRAFDEINEFEAELESWGAVLIKFWIDVSSDEQLRRFKERQEDPAKQWKITDEDWRNREKNDLYRVCVNDMLRLTSTEYAPWYIVESDDKYYARVKALRIINEHLEAKLASIYGTRSEKSRVGKGKKAAQ